MHTLQKCTLAICTSGTLMLLLFTDPGLSDEGVHLRAAAAATLLRCKCCCLQMPLSPPRGQILAHR